MSFRDLLMAETTGGRIGEPRPMPAHAMPYLETHATSRQDGGAFREEWAIQATLRVNLLVDNARRTHGYVEALKERACRMILREFYNEQRARTERILDMLQFGTKDEALAETIKLLESMEYRS